MMNSFLLVVGTVGSIASIISFFFPGNRKNRILNATYIFFVAVVVAIAVAQERSLSEMKSIELDALQLVKSREMEFTHRGFVQATLAFLEKHREAFPEANIRAKNMCEQLGCFDGRATDVEMVSVAFEMSGLLIGISKLSD